MNYTLKELLDIPRLRDLLDSLDELHSMPSAILDTEGNILTATAWQDICTKFHRVNSDTEKMCIESDRHIEARLGERTPHVIYRCPMGLMDAAMPIVLEGEHLGNVFTGQLFMEAPDEEYFINQARKFGFDEDAYLEALRKVPLFSEDKLHKNLNVIHGLTQMLAEQGLQNKRLQESGERQRIILQTAMSGFWLADMQGRLIEVNDAYCRMSGYSEQELLAMSIQDLEAVENPEETVARIKKIKERGEDSFESRHRRKDGTVFDVEVSTQYQPYGGGQCVAFLRDISERKQADQRANSALNFMQKLMDAIPAPVFYKDAECVYLGCNKPFEQYLGLPAEQIIGKGVYDIAPPDLAEKYDKCDRELLNNPGTQAYEASVVYADGSRHHVVFNKATFDNADGKVAGLIGVMLDVTERKQAEEKLIRSEQNFRSIIEASPVPLAINDEQGNITFVNRAFVQTVGYTLDDISTLAEWWPRAYPDPLYRQMLIDKWQENMAWAQQTGNPMPAVEVDVTCKDGSVRTFICSTSAMREAFSGTHLVFLYDITDRKQAEMLLQQSEKGFRKLSNEQQIILNASSVGIALVKNRKIVWANPAHCMIFGYEADTTYNVDTMELYADLESYEILGDRAYSIIASGGIYSEEVMMKKQDGTPIWCSLVGQAVSHENVEEGSIWIVQDITERKRTEEQRAELEVQLISQTMLQQRIIDLLPDATFAIDSEHRVIAWNKAMAEMTGISEAEMLGKGDYVYAIPFYGESRPLLIDMIGVKMETVLELYSDVKVRGNSLVSERIVQMEGNDGTRHHWFSAAPLLDQEGHIIGAIESLRDVTEFRQAEEERELLRDQLLQSQKMEAVGQLAGGVAHDFNNMLGVIIGYAELALMKMEPSQPFYNNFKEISSAASRSADLTRQLLAFARKQSIAPKVLDLNTTVAGMLSMLQRLIGEDINLSWHPASSLWPVKVDPSQIDQLLANLCVNARHAISDVGRIIIETGNSSFDSHYCSNHTYVEPGEYVALVVSDDGCGMDKETLAHIFEPFFTTKGVGEGTGLGLATVYGIVKQNNGFVNVYSEPGQGTTFTIYLPRHTGENGESLNEGAHASAPRGTETILLVEDEPSILQMTALLLEGQGYTVLTAGTVAEAIRLFAEHTGTIHLLITDVVMPDMNGRDLVKELHSLNPQLRCLFMSGYTANVIALHGVLDEGVNFIQKPFSLQDLAKKVREVLDGSI